MTTLSSAIRSEPLARAPGRYDRAFYSGLSIAMALTVFAGFARTFYGPVLLGGPLATLTGGPLSPLVQMHALFFTAWVLLFVAQTTLVAARRVSVHRRLGIAGSVLAAGMVFAGLRTAIATAARGSAPAGTDPLSFLVIPIFDLVLFSGFIIAALAMRRQKEAHKRLMLLAYVSIIAAATARLPGVLVLPPPVFFGLALVFAVAGAVYDFASRGRVHPVYWWGGGAIVVSVPLRLAISTTAIWKSFAGFLVS
ncbi:MAG TPA: hypothetical protein VM096_10680 [Vicinamibacterales bacterium]|nr:hypothetical protein [Vicinamibacterales bacterium]